MGGGGGVADGGEGGEADSPRGLAGFVAVLCATVGSRASGLAVFFRILGTGFGFRAVFFEVGGSGSGSGSGSGCSSSSSSSRSCRSFSAHSAVLRSMSSNCARRASSCWRASLSRVLTFARTRGKRDTFWTKKDCWTSSGRSASQGDVSMGYLGVAEAVEDVVGGGTGAFEREVVDVVA